MGDLECQGCTACCRHRHIVLLAPGEDSGLSYDPLLKKYAVNHQGIPCLPMKINGDCLYLGDRGCTIYEKRPYVCRAFDCRVSAVRGCDLSQEVVAAARQRMMTLDKDQRDAVIGDLIR